MEWVLPWNAIRIKILGIFEVCNKEAFVKESLAAYF